MSSQGAIGRFIEFDHEPEPEELEYNVRNTVASMIKKHPHLDRTRPEVTLQGELLPDEHSYLVKLYPLNRGE